MRYLMETNRLALRRLVPEDEPALCRFLGNPQVMYAWEHGFSPQEVRDWISRNLARYEKDGYGYFAAVEQKSGRMVGNIGLLREPIRGEERLCLGYLLDNRYWGMGYATEGAKACLDYAFKYLIAPEVLADIRPGNTPSRRVAERLGMRAVGEFVKVYRGKEMPHLIYRLGREDL